MTSPAESAPAPTLDDLRDRAGAAEFAVRVGDALAGTLNLRRTLGRVVTLVVPELAPWAAVELLEGGAVRRVSAALGRRVHDEASPGPLAPAAPAGGPFPTARLRRPADAAALVEAGVEAPLADRLTDGAAVDLVALPLRAHGSVLGRLTAVCPAADAGAVEALQVVADRAALAVAAARVYEERAELAAALRRALAPTPLPQVPGVELGASYRPAQETTQIGGDFYEVAAGADGEWTFVMGDVCGKGVGAAVLSGRARQSLRTATLVAADPAAALRLLNEAMIATDGSTFVTLVHGRLRRDGDLVRVRLASGGHPRPLVLRRDGGVEPVDVSGVIVGMLPEATFRTAEVSLAPGETLLLYTDGVTEARVGDVQLGVERLAALLADCRGMPAQAVTERVEQMVLDYLGGRPHDDVALLAVRAREETAG